ncbi:hypothetical protein [Massilia sp. YIM B02443]|uniref:hypothetical protein n=1 Tax=Massilia sp. YIM B02443 TaxID=3050127 RepID=UPI0025B6D3B6|nr:hypothetical protein [Massilia sp. YIM B02443]MDN4035633.1 hypothetical protein [Massilia sp. YIM B02443]
MNHDPAFDASIPVLTEVVTEPKADPAVAAEAVDPVAPAVAAERDVTDDIGEQLERRAVDRWSGEQWSVLERRVTNRILQQLQGRVDFVLEQRLREGIAEAVERALGDLADEIRLGLQGTLGEVVSRAVSQEIAHIQTLGK